MLLYVYVRAGWLKENPLYLEEKVVKVLSYHLNASRVHLGKGGSTQPLALYFRNLLIFLWGFLRRTKSLLWESWNKGLGFAFGSACGIVSSFVFVIHFQLLRDFICWTNPLPSQVTGRYGLEIQSGILSTVSYEPLLWWWYLLQEHLIKERKIIMASAYCIEQSMALCQAGDWDKYPRNRSCLDISATVTNLFGA